MLSFFSPLVALFINVIIQVCLFRFYLRDKLLRTLFMGFFSGLTSLIIVKFAFLSNNELIWLFLANLITYICLGYCYFHFINLGETARRIRILRELYDSKKGLTIEELLSRYNAKEIIDKRIIRLLNNKQIMEKDAKFYIVSPVMLSISKTIIFLKILLTGKRSEYEG